MKILFYAFSMQQIGKEEDVYQVIEGKVPVLGNEIMVTAKTAEELNVGIGDTLYYKGEDEVRSFLVTGTYQSMMNMGNGFRVSKNAVIPYEYLSGGFGIQAAVDSEGETKALIEQIKGIFPDYTVKGVDEFLNDMIGGVLRTKPSRDGRVYG